MLLVGGPTGGQVARKQYLLTSCPCRSARPETLLFAVPLLFVVFISVRFFCRPAPQCPMCHQASECDLQASCAPWHLPPSTFDFSVPQSRCVFSSPAILPIWPVAALLCCCPPSFHVAKKHPVPPKLAFSPLFQQGLSTQATPPTQFLARPRDLLLPCPVR